MSQRETVLLVHGLWVHGVLMTYLQRHAAHRGYRALTYSYPSLRLTLTENADRLALFCRKLGAPRLHLVGHSLGGLVILKMLERSAPPNVGRIVLAGTPFADSFAARRLLRLPGGRTALGRSMLEWLKGGKPSGFERYELGVIAGSSGIGLGRLVAPGLPQPSDGVVTVAETWVPAARDHIVLKVSHTSMLVSNAVAREIYGFINRGAFDHRDQCPES